MKLKTIALMITYLLLVTGIANAIEFAEPLRIQADGKPIDTENIGHAAPFVCDFDDDGIEDLLVGEFSGGVLWIYRNEGTNKNPKLAAGVKFKDGKPDGTVPCG